MENALLVLCPDDPHWIPPDEQGLILLLQNIQLISTPLDEQKHYLTGEKFLDLIAFMGCSPDIKLEPGEDKRPFCHIHLQLHADRIEFHCGNRPHTPRCPECSSPVNLWQTRIKSWLEDDATALWECEACGIKAAPWNYNWRKSAGFGRCFIEIRNIFPKEAIPQQHLLDTLNSHYGIKWHYFYQY
jgi:hypothetical protein